MIRFIQPEDDLYLGKNVWINPDDITTVEPAGSERSIITLRDGRQFTVKGNHIEIAEQINKA